MAGVQAQAQSAPAAGCADQRLELVDRATERSSGAGRVLDVQVAAVAVCERSSDRLTGPRDRFLGTAVLCRTCMQNHAASADLLAEAQRVGQRGERFGAQVTVLAGAVEQVHGVDHDGLDRARCERLVERRDLLSAMGARLPAARRLAEDLDRLAASLSAALHRELQAARERDVGADQHARSKPLTTERR